MKALVKRSVVGITVASGLLALSGMAAEAASLSDQVKGTGWHLVSITVTPTNGKSMQPYGSNPTGYTIFDRTGHFVTVLSKPDVPKFASHNPYEGTDAEQRAAWQGTSVDFGTYKVDEKSHTLILHVVGANYPNWVGIDLHDVTAVNGDQMTWTKEPTITDKARVAFIWERLR